MSIDVVYPLKRSDGPDDELRYSLRSLKNLPHGRVFLIGGRPAWADNITHIVPEPGITKYKDAAANIRAACESDLVSDPFILMNDDFFVMRPIDQVPVLNRGRSVDVEADYEARYPRSAYLTGMRATRQHLESLGYHDPLSFALHVPIVVHKQMLLKAMDLGAEFPVWHIRTAYGALAMLEGETIQDVKVNQIYRSIPDSVFVSTSDRVFTGGKAGRQIRSRFPRIGPYERTN